MIRIKYSPQLNKSELTELLIAGHTVQLGMTHVSSEDIPAVIQLISEITNELGTVIVKQLRLLNANEDVYYAVKWAIAQVLNKKLPSFTVVLR